MSEELARKAAANALESLAFDIGPFTFYVKGMTPEQCSELTVRFRNLLRNRAEELTK